MTEYDAAAGGRHGSRGRSHGPAPPSSTTRVSANGRHGTTAPRTTNLESLSAQLRAGSQRHQNGNNVSGKILIVDDHAHVRELLKITLEVGPYQLIMAEDGAQALDIVEREQPDVVLLDVNFRSGINGFEVCRRIRQLPDMLCTHVIMLTARGQEKDRRLGKEAGADQYLTKPFSPIELLESIEKAVANGRVSG